jgi:carbon storage regulator CsrA
MLVLSRKTAQQIQIGPHVTITILKVKGETVRIGIEAPKDVCVLRSEVAEKLVGAQAVSGEAEATVRSALASSERERARTVRNSGHQAPVAKRGPRVELASRFEVGQSSLRSHMATRSQRLAVDLTPRVESTTLTSLELSVR